MATGLSKTKWNGKRLHKAPAPLLSNASLDVSLSYEGKRPYPDILATAPAETRTLWGADKSSETLQSNRLYYGDNLHILSALLNDAAVRGQVRLIYIDPPFATKSVFQSRTQTDAYADLLAGAHYIEFMRERLIMLRELLADNGSMYVHLDDNMAFHIKVIMDEIFGAKHFRNWITRKKCNPKNYTRKAYGNVADYILFYTKSDDYVWNRAVEPWTGEELPKEYRYVEAETGRHYMKVPVHAPGTRNGETGRPWRGMLPPPGKHWQYSPKTLDEMDARGEIYWSPSGNPRRKVYLDMSEGIPVQDIWLDVRDAHNQNIEVTGYPTEKNPELLTRIIRASSNPGDLVLDSFSGSGTTLATASQLQRRWIGVDNSVEAISTSLRRFTRGLERMGDYASKRHSTRGQRPVAETLPMFAPEELPSVKPLPSSHKSIGDFSLYAEEPYTGELDEVVTMWSKDK